LPGASGAMRAQELHVVEPVSPLLQAKRLFFLTSHR